MQCVIVTKFVRSSRTCAWQADMYTVRNKKNSIYFGCLSVASLACSCLIRSSFSFRDCDAVRIREWYHRHSERQTVWHQGETQCGITDAHAHRETDVHKKNQHREYQPLSNRGRSSVSMEGWLSRRAESPSADAHGERGQEEEQL
jgi:hypothetical protein